MAAIQIDNGTILLPDGSMEPGSVVVEEGLVSEIKLNSSAGGGTSIDRLDARGMWVLPGIVDIHGDAFERQLMPRAGVQFPFDMAFLETDRQMVANGITTAFHGVTYSWEPGLRGRDNFIKIKKTLSEMKDTLACDTKLHVRFETYNLDAVDEIVDWMESGEIDLLAFNDHTPKIFQEQSDPKVLAKYSGRAGIKPDAFIEILDRVIERSKEIPDAIRRLASAATKSNIALLSHDDDSSDIRQFYNELGCSVSEFPINDEAISKAKEYGNDVVMGSPNVVRGGSHNGGIRAADMIEAGHCNILATDYYYPSALSAVFKLIHENEIDVGQAWNLVSSAPARACGLEDRGSLTPGKKADILVVNPDPHLPRIVTTMVDGKPVYQA